MATLALQDGEEISIKYAKEVNGSWD